MTHPAVPNSQRQKRYRDRRRRRVKVYPVEFADVDLAAALDAGLIPEVGGTARSGMTPASQRQKRYRDRRRRRVRVYPVEMPVDPRRARAAGDARRP
jgi:hypothetical protein